MENRNNNHIILAAGLWLLSACGNQPLPYDASGTFEAVETLVPAEANGVLKQFTVEEGQHLDVGASLGYIDTAQLYLRKKELQARITAILSKRPDIAAQLAALQEELRHAKNEQERLANLLQADAATQKQYDDASAEVNVIRKQIVAQQSTLGITSTALNEETATLYVQLEQLDDQLAKSCIINPVKGTVLTKYMEAHEMATIGKPLYRIADVSSLLLRAYVPGTLFDGIKLGQQVRVQVDRDKDGYKTYNGVIEWISDKAEFTPKTIQTKNERANLVYAIKVRVKNDGFLKIGMYGQILFDHKKE